MAGNGYAGRIKNSGTQNVKAPYSNGGGSKGTVKITGSDLRTGKKKTGK